MAAGAWIDVVVERAERSEGRSLTNAAAAIVQRMRARAAVLLSRIARSMPLRAVAGVLAALTIFGQLAPATAAVALLFMVAAEAVRTTSSAY